MAACPAYDGRHLVERTYAGPKMRRKHDHSTGQIDGASQAHKMRELVCRQFITCRLRRMGSNQREFRGPYPDCWDSGPGKPAWAQHGSSLEWTNRALYSLYSLYSLYLCLTFAFPHFGRGRQTIQSMGKQYSPCSMGHREGRVVRCGATSSSGKTQCRGPCLVIAEPISQSPSFFFLCVWY